MSRQLPALTIPVCVCVRGGECLVSVVVDHGWSKPRGLGLIPGLTARFYVSLFQDVCKKIDNIVTMHLLASYPTLRVCYMAWK